VKKRAALTQHEKYVSFKTAFDNVKSQRETGNYLAAFIVAFSIFEDRLAAAVMLAADLNNEPRPTGHLRLYGRVAFLRDRGHLDDATSKDWRSAGDERNDLIHSAMWQVDAVEDGHVVAAIRRARSADNLAARLRRKVAALDAGKA